ncbi:MAG: hypothetical protein J6S63_07760 [Atopobiaceae bacterium]|nr:hypothetical protein [Atopobiaceae bacterium]
MIRTNSVTLSMLPAVAYRQKFASGGSGVVIVRSDATQPGIASISKTSGEAIVSANTPRDLYPQEAFEEAIALTAGMPYRKQGKPKPFFVEAADEEAVAQEAPVVEDEPVPEVETVVDSDEYQRIVDAYTDKNGRLSYALLNKELIQFAHSSEMVSRMLAAGEDEETIRLYIVGTKFRNVTENKNLTDEQVLKMAALLDEVSPKGVFKELNAELRARFAERKRS